MLKDCLGVWYGTVSQASEASMENRRQGTEPSRLYLHQHHLISPPETQISPLALPSFGTRQHLCNHYHNDNLLDWHDTKTNNNSGYVSTVYLKVKTIMVCDR